MILNAPGANPRTKLIAFVKFIEGRRLCDLTVVSIVQDDIKGLNPITTFPDAVDNIIAINLLQEELTLMGQPYSDSDLIIQHSNKMPNSDDFRSLKMEFIDCDVSQFSTSRPTLTHSQPNPLFLRLRKTWDEYCHKVQRYSASEPQNQPQSALSARMDMITAVPTLPTVLAASSAPDLEATIRKILAEVKPTSPPRREYQARQQVRQARFQHPPVQAQPPRYQGQLPPPQRPSFQPPQSRPYQDQPRNQYRQPYQDRQTQPPSYSNMERRPRYLNKRAFDAMESHNDYNGMEGEESSAYGAHHEYADDDTYQDPHYVMSAAMESTQDWDSDKGQEGTTYAS